MQPIKPNRSIGGIRDIWLANRSADGSNWEQAIGSVYDLAIEDCIDIVSPEGHEGERDCREVTELLCQLKVNCTDNFSSLNKSSSLRVMENRYLSLRALADGSLLRTAVYNSVSYIVVPIVTAVGDNVWWPANAPTPELVPASVLAAHAFSRNNRPVVMGHPKSGGDYCSANSPEILEKYCFGHMFASVFDKDRIKVEAWLDPARAKLVGPDAEKVISRLQAGEQVEVSEGDFVVTVVEKGEFGGKSYGARWVSAVSDHLAILPEGDIGACNNEMGCGGPRVAILRTSSEGSSGADPWGLMFDLPTSVDPEGSSVMRMAGLSSAHLPSFTGTETSAWVKPPFADYVKYLDNSATPPTSVTQCSSELKAKIAAHTLLGDPSATSFADISLLAVVNPATDKLNERALRGVLSTTSTSIDAKALASAQEIARRLLNSEFSANISASALSEGNKMKQTLFIRMAAKIRAAMSNNSLRWKLTEAISAIEPGVQFVDDEDVAKGLFRYAVMISFGYSWDDDSKVEYHTYQRSFTIDASDNVTINNDRVELVYDEEKAWVPVTEPDAAIPELEMSTSAASCGCGNVYTNNQTQEGETEMAVNNPATAIIAPAPVTVSANQKSLAGKLIASTAAPFEESDRTVLESMDEKKLEALAKTYEGEAVVEQVSVTASAATLPGISPAAPVRTLTEDEYLSLKSAADAHQRQQAARRTHLVTGLKTAQASFTEAELTAMDMNTLEKMAGAFKVDEPAVADYSIGSSANSTLGVSAADKIKAHTPTDTWANARAARDKRDSARATN